MTDLRAALRRQTDVLVTLDIETYWDAKYSLRNPKMTTEAYVRDPRWEVIGVGVKFGDRAPVWLEEYQFRHWAARVNWKRVALCCHHSQFDGFALYHHYGISPGMHIDTMSMGRTIGARSVGLDALAQKFGLGYKGKEVEHTRGKRRRDFTDAEWKRFGAYCLNDVELTDKLRTRLRAQFPTLELYLVDLTVRAFTEPVFGADQDVLREALADERAKKVGLLRRLAKNEGIEVPENATEAQALEAARAVLSSSDKFAALLLSMGEAPPMKLSPKAKNADKTPKRIYAFAKGDPGMKELLDHRNPEVRALAEARLAVKSTIVETRTERLISIAQRGAVPFYLKYAGAHTHRWSGGDKMNPQNFNRPDPKVPGSGALRRAILAPPGHTLVVVDSGQIEARFVGWVAGQADLLETFRRNDQKTHLYETTGQGAKGDFYSDVGSTFFLRTITKADIERQISKAMVLGLGFGMGFLKFATELLKGMLGADPVQFTMQEAAQFGVNPRAFWAQLSDKQKDKIRETPTRLELKDFVIHCAVADYFVRLYRKKNAFISRAWDAAGKMIAVMAADEGPEVRGTFGCLKVIRHGLVKPNGLVLHYPGLQRRGKDFFYLGGKGGRELSKLYGGLLIENIVQSLARDCIAEQALWISTRYRIGTTTHDEVVSVVPEARAEECLAYSLERLKSPPAWCSDIPLYAEGGFARSYADAK